MGQWGRRKGPVILMKTSCLWGTLLLVARNVIYKKKKFFTAAGSPFGFCAPHLKQVGLLPKHPVAPHSAQSQSGGYSLWKHKTSKLKYTSITFSDVRFFSMNVGIFHTLFLSYFYVLWENDVREVTLYFLRKCAIFEDPLLFFGKTSRFGIFWWFPNSLENRWFLRKFWSYYF